MAIPKKPPRITPEERQSERHLEKFVAAAPDSKPANPLREKKIVINIPIRPSFLKEVDEACVRMGISRGAFFAMTASLFLDGRITSR